MGVPLNVTEWMRGYIGPGATDCDAGFIAGREQGHSFMHEVVIAIDDIDRFINEPTHTARMDGHIECALFGGRRPVVGGVFNMLVDTSHPGLKVMLYRMPFSDASGARRTILGHKTIHNDRALDLWGDITRLAIRVFDSDVSGPDVSTTALGPATIPAPVAMGILHIELRDGVRSALSFASPGAGPVERARAVQKFCCFYSDKLWEVFGPGS